MMKDHTITFCLTKDSTTKTAVYGEKGFSSYAPAGFYTSHPSVHLCTQNHKPLINTHSSQLQLELWKMSFQRIYLKWTCAEVVHTTSNAATQTQTQQAGRYLGQNSGKLLENCLPLYPYTKTQYTTTPINTSYKCPSHLQFQLRIREVKYLFLYYQFLSLHFS